MTSPISKPSAFTAYSKKECPPPTPHSVDRIFAQQRVYHEYRSFRQKWHMYKIGPILQNEFGHPLVGKSKEGRSVGCNPRLIAVVTDLRRVANFKHLSYFGNKAQEEIQRNRFLKEAPHLAKLHDAFYMKNHMYVMILDHLGTTLWDRLLKASPIPTRQLIRLMTQFTETLAFIHREGILHGDISLTNCSEYGELFDFGLSEEIGRGGYTRLLKYSRYYRPPETVIKGVSVLHSDIWALGAVFFYTVIGEALTPVLEITEDLLQEDINMVHAYQQRLSITFDKKLLPKKFLVEDELRPSTLPPLPSLQEALDSLPYHPKKKHLVDLLQKMLQLAPLKRPSAEEILNHPFFRKYRTEYSVQLQLQGNEDLAISIFAETQPSQLVGSFRTSSSCCVHFRAFPTPYRFEVWKPNDRLLGVEICSLSKDREIIRISTAPFSIGKI